MDKNICNMIVVYKNQFIPHLFTKKQVMIIQKRMANQHLTNTEKTYLYSTIKKKIGALALLREEWHITGKEMIPERIEEAKHILKELHKEKAFISGSFLYAKEYNDIDIFIVGNRRKQYREGKKNFILITEKDLTLPIFYSCSQYCVANFTIPELKPVIKRDEMDEFLLSYQLAINEILDNDEQKTTRYIVFLYYMNIKGFIPNSYEAYQAYQEISKKSKEEKIKIVNNMIKELLLNTFSNRYTYEVLRGFNKRLEKNIQEYKKNDGLIIYHTLLEEVKNECRRNQETIA